MWTLPNEYWTVLHENEKEGIYHKLLTCDSSSLRQRLIRKEILNVNMELSQNHKYLFLKRWNLSRSVIWGSWQYLHKMIWGCSAQHGGDRCPVHRSMLSSSWLLALHHAHSSLQVAEQSSLRQPPPHAPDTDLQCIGSRVHGPPPVVWRNLPKFLYMLRVFKF